MLASSSEFDDDESEVLELLSTIEELENSTSDDDSGVFTEFVTEDPSSPHAAKRIDAASKIFIFMIVPLLYKFILPDN
ncbi:MAG: hypothetical protein IKN03_02445 [Fibrobacter sp.]|nr:hypothetical protein [Fibrobacter sp.]